MIEEVFCQAVKKRHKDLMPLTGRIWWDTRPLSEEFAFVGVDPSETSHKEGFPEVTYTRVMERPRCFGKSEAQRRELAAQMEDELDDIGAYESFVSLWVQRPSSSADISAKCPNSVDPDQDSTLTLDKLQEWIGAKEEPVKNNPYRMIAPKA